jgi:hypothetical protein
MTLTITLIKTAHSTTPVAKSAYVHAEKFHVVATKNSLVLDALLAGRRLTARDAAFEMEIFCLAGLIYYLRKHYDIPVKTQMIKKTHADGLITRYAEYFLTPSDIAEFQSKKVPQ